MSDPEDLFLNQLFSTDPPPDGLFFQPFPLEHLEYPNDDISGDAMDLSEGFPGADNHLLMSENQFPGPTQLDPIYTVGDPSNTPLLQSSNWPIESSTDLMDPTLLVQYGAEYISDPIQEMPSSMALPAPECLGSQAIEHATFIPSASDPPISMTITPQKRKHLGISRHYEVPPLKKGGRRGKMSQKEKEERKKMRKQGACITCRSEKQKCDEGIPCSLCLKKGEPKLSKRPCTKATFLDIVLDNPCFEFSNTYQNLVIEKCDNKSFFEQFAAAVSLADAEMFLELVPDIPLYAGTMTSWGIAVLAFMSVPAIRDTPLSTDLSLLPPLAPFMKKAPSDFMKIEEYRGMDPFLFDVPSKDLDHRTLFMKKLLFCGSHSRTFNIYDSQGIIHYMGDNEAVQNAADLLDWFATRYFEIDIFSYLQKSVTKLHKLSTSDNYDLITSLVAVIGILSSYWDCFAKSSLSLDQEVIENWEDRNRRLHMALFVYADIAISKAPSWSSYWEKLEPEFLVQWTSHEFRDLFTDFISFRPKWDAKQKQISVPFDRFSLRYDILKGFDPSFGEEIPDHDEKPGDFLKFPRILQSGLVDEAFDDFDVLHMGGLLSATMSGNFNQVRRSKFYSLANIDWELAIERLLLGYCDLDSFNDLLLFYLCNTLRSRLHLAQECSTFKTIYTEDNFIPEQFVQDLENCIKESIHKENTAIISYRKQRRRVLLKIREGLRWLELKSLVGGEEIYLLDNPFEHLEPGDILLRFNIPSILKHGNDEDFDRLKKLIGSSQSWVQETCAQLRGMVSWIKEATIACKLDKDTALILSKRIQQKVKSVFGDAPLVDQSLLPVIRKLASELEVRPEELVQALVEREDNLSFNEEDNLGFNEEDNLGFNEENDEDEDEDGDEDKTASLVKSIQSLLSCHPIAPPQGQTTP